MFSSLWNDVRYEARGLRHNPGFTAVAVLAIALGIGVNTGIFSVLNGAALRPLPARDPNELVSIHQDFHGGQMRSARGARSMFSLLEYQNYHDHNQTLSGLMAYAPLWTVTLGGERPQEIIGEIVSCNYFDVLRQSPAVGPGFTASNCETPGAPPVVVLSHDLWTNALASDPAIIGRSIELNRENFRVAGVAAPGFHGTEAVRSTFWAPISAEQLLSRDGGFLTDDRLSWLLLVGRKKPSTSIDQVRADLAVIAGQIDQLEPGRVTSLSVQRATSFAEPQTRRALIAGSTVVLAGFGLVLLIACANVANLLLARAAGRKKEIAVRLSVGASRGRLIQQLLTESVLIALAGGALGSLFALWSFRSIAAFVLARLPSGIPPLVIDTTPDLRVFSFALALTFVTGVLFGLMPAIQASRPDLNVALKEDSAGSGRRSGGFLRNALVGVQVAVCMLLLISAGLLLRGLYAAQTIDPGFEYKKISVVSFDLRGQGYDDAKGAAFQKRVQERIGSLPGVDRVAQVSVPPLSAGSFGTIFTLPGDNQLHRTEYNPVSPEYFSVVGIPIVRGRTFTVAETQGSPNTVIVTEGTARRFWPGEDPIGKTLVMGVGKNQRGTFEIVGVAKDAQVSRVGETDTVYLYTPAGPNEQRAAQLLVRSALDFASTTAGIRAEMQDLDPHLVVNVNRLEDNLDFWRALSRLVAGLSGSLGTLALLLASIGVYGVVSYGVSRRLREVGIRMVLGADPREVLAMVLRQAMRPVLAGAAIGVVACAGVSRILSGVLFGVSALDPVAFVVAGGFLLLVALAACLVPAFRATRVDPLTTLRYE
ncbi:MAG: ABC transporter permease [Acidobacteriia bacterium]|nr:ABC transporter permease [Terriglobia bacterium]